MSEQTTGRTRRLLANALTAALVLGAVGGGVAYTAGAVDRADRTAPTVGWAEHSAPPTPEDPAVGFAEGRASTPLSKLLLPVPDGYELGADIEGHGNDDEIAAEKAVALFKQTSRGLYGKERREYEKEIDKLGIQGMAMRSYATEEGTLHAEVEVLRMKDRKAVREFFEFRKDFLDFLKLRKGPKVKGHTKNSACHLGPEPKAPEGRDGEVPLQEMVCAAYDGEILVTVKAAGAEPFDKKAVAELLEKQLRHIESPGEYV
ncbi:hypothetical protein [Streptomyces gardneri]|uniref:hypothetical protein n=1 Tax=Streptomyces gardneri TaxID=66892 RepID=UPI0035DF7511